MRAWHFHGTHKPLEMVLDKPEPSPSAGEVKIAVKAAGLCHTDVGVLEDAQFMPLFVELPVAPGHEIAGVIEELGEGVEGFSVGDRVTVLPTLSAPVGFGVNGGYQEKVVVAANSLVPIPEGVPFTYAASSACAGMTAHHSMMTRGQLKAGMKVGIIGVGGVGQIAANLAVLNGAELYVAEINENAWPLAREIGAKRVVSDIREFADENLDLIVDYAGFGSTTAGAVETVRFGGRVVQVGMGKMQFDFNAYPLIMREIELVGSMGGSHDDVAGVLSWMSKGSIKPQIEEIDWEQMADGVGRLARGEVRGRLTAVYK